MNTTGMKIIRIAGIPDVKMRPRFSRKTGHAYDPNAEAKEASIQKAVLEGDAGAYVGALAVEYEFRFPRPKSHYGTGRNASVLKASAPAFCMDPKDLDNLEKFYSDSFNCIHYNDDKQICQCWGSVKRFVEPGEMPGVVMKIYPLEDVDKKRSTE